MTTVTPKLPEISYDTYIRLVGLLALSHDKVDELNSIEQSIKDLLAIADNSLEADRVMDAIYGQESAKSLLRQCNITRLPQRKR